MFYVLESVAPTSQRDKDLCCDSWTGKNSDKEYGHAAIKQAWVDALKTTFTLYSHMQKQTSVLHMWMCVCMCVCGHAFTL